MALDDNWFSEADPKTGTAFSLKLGEKLHEEQTPFQRIEIYQTETFGKLMVIDGCTMVSTRDNFLYHEMMAHAALFAHPDPRRVVIIGGGDCGTLREVLKHPSVEYALQVDIDERVTRLSEEHFAELCESNNDPRAELYFGDGIAWMAEAEPGSVDVVIVDSTDPVGPAEGLFNRAFYSNVHRALGENGIMQQQSESPFLHLPIVVEMHKEMQAAGFADTRLLNFPQPLYPSGWWSATQAVKDPAQAVRFEAIDPEALKSQYYTAETHRAALALPPFVEAALKTD
ncbi:MAG: polyamine aminopropyltransferase [Salinisphaeraceae bacterium]|nr:polyamine aminopropyltransferase [Salinisphaeraceae bacterium]